MLISLKELNCCLEELRLHEKVGYQNYYYEGQDFFKLFRNSIEDANEKSRPNLLLKRLKDYIIQSPTKQGKMIVDNDDEVLLILKHKEVIRTVDPPPTEKRQ